ncbi:Pyridoxal kinase [Aphelenchoides besseyi]|nr:Pyridoxal kinase [Aphelenchoides besseyi]
MSEAEQRLRKIRAPQRVLSIQSHVVSGYAGNKAAVFPLQLHGFEVDIINSVQFSNHTGHQNGVRGGRLNSTDLQELFIGLEANNLLDYTHVLTGYCGDVSFLRKIVEIVKKLKNQNPHLTFVCDPVLGDHGFYYTPKELMPIYRDEVLSLADVLTPNAFELSEITGLPCTNESECFHAMDKIHKNYNVKYVVTTSGIENKSDEILYCFGSVFVDGKITRHRFEISKIRGNYVGTGDVFTSLLLVWLTETNGNLELSISNVIRSLQLLLKRQSKDENEKPTFKQRELCLIESRFDLLVPSGDGLCETNSTVSEWCLFDRTHGIHSCDLDGFCSGNSKLKDRPNTAGCVGTKCCCNQGVGRENK